MRYQLDANGYVLSVFWGCNSGNCSEYTGTVPSGYTDLTNWSEKAIINAYYINDEGNLTLDADRLAELETQIEQDAIDYTPLTHKDLYGTNNVLDSQYQRATDTGEVIQTYDAKKINPKVTFTNIECYKYNKLDIITQGKQMLKNDAKTETIAGVTFTKNLDGSITLNGTSTEAIEYNFSGGSDNTSSIFALKKDLFYYLDLGGLSCLMKYYDGTTSIVYEGYDGIISISENKEVTQVLITIPTGKTFSNIKIYPMLNYGFTPYAYEEYKAKKLTLDFSEYIKPDALFPADDLYPTDDLYPLGTSIEYIHIEDGKVYISVNGVVKYLSIGNVNLFDGYNLVYTMQETNIEMEYCINNLALEGTTTKNNNFKVLEDGSIEAHNGLFSGKIEATEGEIGGFDLGVDSFTSDIIPKKDYTDADVSKLAQHLVDGTTLTDEEKWLYDANSDGILNVVDTSMMRALMNANISTTKPGKLEINSKNPMNAFVIKDGDGKDIIKFGIGGIVTPRLSVGGRNVVIEEIIWEATSTDDELGSYGILESDFSAYKYVDVYFRAHGVQSSETAGNGINNVLRIDLGTPSTFPIITKNGVTYHYGASNMYPDAQFFVGVTDDPGFFIEGVFIDWHKRKLMVGNIGYYIISSGNIGAVYSDAYEKVYKVVGYK